MKESKWFVERFGKERAEPPQRAKRGSLSSEHGGSGRKRADQGNVKKGGISAMYRKESAGAGTPAQVLRCEVRNSYSDHLVAYDRQSVKIFSSIVNLIFRAFAASTARFRLASPI